jgi:AbrB family looped-hinge helix DNA binding protein
VVIVTIRAGFRVVIPKAIRTRLALRVGQRLLAVQHGDRIELVPMRPARQLRGFLRGIDTAVPRERD